jgi:hypothetical protein
MKEYGLGLNGPECQCHHRMVKVNDRYMFLNKDFFSRWFLLIANLDCIPYGMG